MTFLARMQVCTGNQLLWKFSFIFFGRSYTVVLSPDNRVADPDPHNFGKPDPDPHQSQKQGPDPQQSQNSGAVEAQNGAWRAVDRSQ